MTLLEVPLHDVVRIQAQNPGPFTLSGTNSWIVGRDPAWLIDPGPRLDEHLEALAAELNDRAGLGGIALTHDHADHAEAVEVIRSRFNNPPLASARSPHDLTLHTGTTFGPLEALATPGHAPDHMAFITDDIGFTGDAVLGEGSVFITSELGAYLQGLETLKARGLKHLCPGHGPLINDPKSKLTEYIEHRLDRERRLIAALDEGLRTQDELLDRVWDDAPAVLRAAAAMTLAAHLEKLADEGRLPPGVQRSARG